VPVYGVAVHRQQRLISAPFLPDRRHVGIGPRLKDWCAGRQVSQTSCNGKNMIEADVANLLMALKERRSVTLTPV